MLFLPVELQLHRWPWHHIVRLYTAEFVDSDYDDEEYNIFPTSCNTVQRVICSAPTGSVEARTLVTRSQIISGGETTAVVGPASEKKSGINGSAKEEA